MASKNKNNDHFNKTPRNKGFTLIEIMAVIAIIGIIAGFTIPSFNNYRNNAKLRGAAVNLNADLQRARFMAIKNNDNVKITFDEEGYLIDGYTITGKKMAEPFRKNLPAGVTINLGYSEMFPSFIVNFNRKGIPSSSGEIALLTTSSDNKRFIEVNRLGIVKIIYPEG